MRWIVINPDWGRKKKGSALWEMMKRKVAFLLLHPAMTKKNATGDCLKSSGGERLAVCALAFCFMPDNSSSVKEILTSPSVKKEKKKSARAAADFSTAESCLLHAAVRGAQSCFM